MILCFKQIELIVRFLYTLLPSLRKSQKYAILLHTTAP